MRFLPLATVEKYEPLAEELGVSTVARSARGFLTAYKRAKTPGNLSPEWHAKREAFIKRHMAQVSMRKEALFDKNGDPSRRHLALIMWAYSPGLRAARSNPEDQTETPAFKRWFKESKVVDENGRPLVVHHGSSKGGFTAFSHDKIDKHHVGFFFSDDANVSRSYVKGRSVGDPTPAIYSSAQELREAIRKYDTPFELEVKYHVGGDLYDTKEELVEDFGGMVQWSSQEEPVPLTDADIEEYYVLFCQGLRVYEGADEDGLLEAANNPDVDVPGVYDVYLSIQDPLVVDAGGSNWNEIPYGETEDGDSWTVTTNDLSREALDMGCDGLIIHNVHDTGAHGYAGDSTVFVVYKPGQVKSAYGNVGTWDENNSDIRRNPTQLGPNELFDALVEHLQASMPEFVCELHCNDKKALNGRKEKRAYAACDGENIYVAHKIYDADYNRYAALLMHELAHAVLSQAGEEDHSEQDADDLAEELFGHRISYDKDDVQTLGKGRYPRPDWLEQ